MMETAVSTKTSLLSELDGMLFFLLALRAAGEPVAGPAGLSKKARNLERRLTNLLMSDWTSSVDDVVQAASSVLLTGSAKVTEEELDSVLKSVEQKLGPSFASKVLTESTDVLTASYSLGRSLFERKDGKPKAVQFNLVDQRATDWLSRDHQYWVGTFYDRKLGEQIAASVKSTILEQGLGRKAAGKALAKVVTGVALDESVVGRSGYWEGVAAIAATRARTFGTIEGLVQAGIEQYEFIAVMDERTSDICRELNGRIFSVATAVDIRDQILAAESPDDVKSITPWVRAKDAQTTSSKDLQAKGACMPPAHFRCRSTVVASFSDASGASVSIPSAASKRTKDAFDVLEPAEVSNKLALLRVDPQHMAFAAEKRMFSLHGNESEFRSPPKSAEDYRSRANALVGSAQNVFGRGDPKHGRVYQFADVNQKESVTVTDSGKILAYVGYDHLSAGQWNAVIRRYRKTHVEIKNLPTGSEAKKSVAAIHPEVKNDKR